MINRYVKLLEFIQDDDDLAEYLPSPAANRTLRKLLGDLKKIESSCGHNSLRTSVLVLQLCTTLTLRLGALRYSALPKQLGTWFGIFIVEFSYDLDIAAIELDMGISLVFNPELKAVNWSNVVSDRLGGYTGSYILL
ncbi:hypothetical protein PC115_g22606 [Phytophthora cactorum]|uniref:Uncharacterized protein n=1 Tax=Phytophthora cactorum TaxID=29920 RepID=A0A8T1AIW0_9STRA|nr:hypothetical protein PC115_g22606 [Phytophthora cactorum]